jgi:hypothetical protein
MLMKHMLVCLPPQAALLYAALLEQKLNAYKGIALSALVTQQLER